MKHTTLGILFSFLYLLAMIKPIYPVIDYIVNYNYIRTELCENRDKPEMHCNGKCYLKKQLKKAHSQPYSNAPETTLPSGLFKDYPISTLDFFSFAFKNNSTDVTQNTDFHYLRHYKYNFTQDIFHPPSLF